MLMLIIKTFLAFVVLWVLYKLVELIATPVVVITLKILYYACGKQDKFNTMLAKFKAKKLKSRGLGSISTGKHHTISDYASHCVNPSTGSPMMHGSSIDVTGNAFGTGRW